MSETIYLVFGKTLCIVGGVAIALLFVGVIACLAAEVWIVARNKWFCIIKVEKLLIELNKHRAEFEEWLDEKGNE